MECVRSSTSTFRAESPHATSAQSRNKRKVKDESIDERIVDEQKV